MFKVKVAVKGQGQRSRSKVNVKGKFLLGNNLLIHQLSADFSGTERKKEEKEQGETIKGLPPGGAW